MKSEQVLAALRGFLEGNHEHATNVIRQMVAHERSVGNNTLASRLERMLNGRVGQMIRLPDAPPGIEFWQGSRDMASVVMSASVRAEVEKFLREWDNREKLSGHGIPIRKTILLTGPSGNGKTTLARAIATRLSLPLGIVSYQTVVDSYRGESMKNIGGVMDFANKRPCVLLFDEADSIVSVRIEGARDSGKEDNRSVNALLMKLDAHHSDSLVIFATNMGADMDPALTRRIGLSLELATPEQEERDRMSEIMEKTYPVLSGTDWRGRTENACSLAAIEAAALSAARELVLAA